MCSRRWEFATASSKQHTNRVISILGARVFWHLLSGDADLYTQIVEPLGHRAKELNRAFEFEKTKIYNKMTREFTVEYCTASGAIDWKKLVEFVKQKSGLTLVASDRPLPAFYLRFDPFVGLDDHLPGDAIILDLRIPIRRSCVAALRALLRGRGAFALPESMLSIPLSYASRCDAPSLVHPKMLPLC